MPVRQQHRRNFNQPGHAHELTFSCYKRLPMLRAERTCRWLLDSVDRARRALDFSVWAYVLMPEHAHLLIWPRQPVYDIARIRKAIKEPVGRQAIAFLATNSPDWLAKLTRKRGRKTERLFWQSGGGYDRNIESPATLLSSIHYFHLNPVRRGLVERAEDWVWSSAAHFSGGCSPLTPDPISADWLE
jgi:putative transposase